jgi:small redox-active disulfide protein 2
LNKQKIKNVKGAFMKTIKVLGPGCKKCKQLEAMAKEAIKSLGDGYEVIKVENIEEMMKYNIMSSPGLVINEKLISSGKTYSVDELKEIFVK